VWLNRNKESICVDLKSEQGRAAIIDLIATADVFIQNFAPGAAERLGLGAEALRSDHPELIVVNMTGYGTAGPLKDRKAYDMLVQAETGLCSITGTPETATKTGVPASDIAAGLYALTSVQAALFRRERTGAGATIDVAMFDATVEWLGHPMYMQMYQDTQIKRMGLSHASIAPYDAYPTLDGQILIGVQNDRGWTQLVTEVFGRPDLADHPRFATNILRVQHRGEVDALVAELTREFKTADLDDKLAQAGVPAAQLNDMRALLEHPQLEARDRWREVGTEAGPIRGVLPPMTFEDVEMRMDAVPALGQQTDAILGSLGRSAEQIESMRSSGIVQ
jgi:formyl-CoA transferase